MGVLLKYDLCCIFNMYKRFPNCNTVLNKKKVFQNKGFFPKMEGFLTLNLVFINKIKGFVNLRGVFVNNNLKIIIEGL